MLKLTRLNKAVVAVNPDHVVLVDVSPDTTIRLTNGHKLIVRETLSELIDKYVEYRRSIHSLGEGVCPLGRTEGEQPTVFPVGVVDEDGE